MEGIAWNKKRQPSGGLPFLLRHGNSNGPAMAVSQAIGLIKSIWHFALSHFFRLLLPVFTERPGEPELRPDDDVRPLLRTFGVLRGCCLTFGVLRDCRPILGVLRGFFRAFRSEVRLTRAVSCLLRPELAFTFESCRLRFGFLFEFETCLSRFELGFGLFVRTTLGLLTRFGCFRTLRSGLCLTFCQGGSNRLLGPLPLLDESTERFRNGLPTRTGC